MLLQKLSCERRPYRHCVGRIDHEVPVASKGWQHAVFGISAGFDKGIVHPFAQFWSKIGVVFRVDPKHRYARGAAEFAGSGYQLVRRTIVVRLAADAASPPRCKGDDGLNRRRVAAPQGDRAPSAARLANDDDLAGLD